MASGGDKEQEGMDVDSTSEKKPVGFELLTAMLVQIREEQAHMMDEQARKMDEQAHFLADALQNSLSAVRTET